MHDGVFSDHVYVYADFNETKYFQGLINKPVPSHSREFVITQKDKKVALQKNHYNPKTAQD